MCLYQIPFQHRLKLKKKKKVSFHKTLETKEKIKGTYLLLLLSSDKGAFTKSGALVYTLSERITPR